MSEDKEDGMEKYAVVTNDQGQGTKVAGEKRVCPDCGSKLDENTSPQHCPKCGTVPFEK